MARRGRPAGNSGRCGICREVGHKRVTCRARRIARPWTDEDTRFWRECFEEFPRVKPTPLYDETEYEEAV